MLLRIAYKSLQRLMVLEGISVMVADAMQSAKSLSYDNRAGLILPETLHSAIARGDAPYCEGLADRILDDRLWCFGAVVDGRLQSFAWFHIGGADADMNYGRQAATATALKLTPNSAFVFHAYTTPAARGQRLLGDVLTQAADWLTKHRGVRHLVATTELVNTSARSAFAQAGYLHQDAYWRYGLGLWAAGWYPAPQQPILAYGEAAQPRQVRPVRNSFGTSPAASLSPNC